MYKKIFCIVSIVTSGLQNSVLAWSVRCSSIERLVLTGAFFVVSAPHPKSDTEDGRLFEWCDGPLVLAMKQEGVFLMDEISLADDSVLERLNRCVKYAHQRVPKFAFIVSF